MHRKSSSFCQAALFSEGRPLGHPLIPLISICIPSPHTRTAFSYSSFTIHSHSLLQLPNVPSISASDTQSHHSYPYSVHSLTSRIPNISMELQHHQSGVLPANGSALNTPSVGTPLDGTSSQHRGVLQERSANWPHDNTASPITNTQHTSQKVSRSQSPTENGYAQQTAAAGNYFTGSLHAQHIGLAGCGVERSEKQIKRDIARLYLLLQRSDKYQKYREKQPVLTPREFIEREAREAKMKVEKDNKSPEKSVWPEFLEHAFWRGEQSLLRFDKGTCRTLVADQNIAALIRWPPMGRKKFMLDGALRGRNELIQDSIYKDTGIRRDRKQVSSHLQVLKQHLKDQPGGK